MLVILIIHRSITGILRPFDLPKKHLGIRQWARFVA